MQTSGEDRSSATPRLFGCADVLHRAVITELEIEQGRARGPWLDRVLDDLTATLTRPTGRRGSLLGFPLVQDFERGGHQQRQPVGIDFRRRPVPAGGRSDSPRLDAKDIGDSPVIVFLSQADPSSAKLIGPLELVDVDRGRLCKLAQGLSLRNPAP